MLLSSDYVADSVARGLAAAWGAEVFRHWGMTETGYGGAVDCAFHCGCHLREDELLVEIVDPVSGAPSPAGTVGESSSRRCGGGHAAVALPHRRSRPADRSALRLRFGVEAARRLRGRVGAAAALASGGELTLPHLDETLFAIEAIGDFAAVIDIGAPATLRLSVAAPAPLRVAATLDVVRARLAEDPVIGAALQAGPCASRSLSPTSLLLAPGETPAGDPGGRAMRTVLLIRHGLVSEDAEDRFLGAADAPMSPAGEAQIRELTARLRPRFTLDAIYCSDLSRSRRTAELLAERARNPDPR